MNKEEFKAKANQTIDEISAKINELKAKKESVKENAKSKYEETIRDLESKQTDLIAKYSEIENTAEDKLEETKEAFSSASDSFKEGFDKLKSLFTVVVLALILASCGSSDKDNKETTMEDVKEEMSDVVDVSKDLGAEKWEELNKQVEELKVDVKAKADKAEAKYNSLSNDAKEKLKSQKQKLDEQRADLNKKIEEYQAAANDKKEGLKAEIDQLKTALDESVSTFEKEMNEGKK